MPTPRLRLGQLLVDARLITPEALDEVLAEQRSDGRRLGTLLVERGLINETQLTQILSHQLSVPWVSLLHIEFSRQLLNLVPRDVADRFCLVPIYVRHVRNQGDTLYVAMDDPTHEDGLRACREHSGLPVRSMIAPPNDIRSAIRVYYGVDATVTATPPPSVARRPPSPAATTSPALSNPRPAELAAPPPTVARPAEPPSAPRPAAPPAVSRPASPPVPPPARNATLPSLRLDAVKAASGPEGTLPVADAAAPVDGARPGAPSTPRAAASRFADTVREPIGRLTPSAPPEPYDAEDAIEPDEAEVETPVARRDEAPPAIEATEIPIDRSRAERLRALLEPPQTPLPPSSPTVENIPRPRGRAPRMVSLTLLDGTTINLPAKRRPRPGEDADPPEARHGRPRTPPSPSREVTSDPPSGEDPVQGLTARDLVLALRVAANGTDASEVLGSNLRWEALFSALLSLLLKKHLIADWEFIEELKKQL